MKNVIKICLTILSIGLLSWQSDYKQTANDEGIYYIEILHPGSSDDKKQNCELFELIEADGLPYEYYMEVKSVFCYDNVCKVEPVKIVWNNIGEYIRYELADDVLLEKNKGEYFKADDYKRLQAILSDSSSVFKSLNITEITASALSHEGVDVVSGATIVDLDNDETVQGATLTCYTLWHWANGDVKSSIRNIAQKSFSNNELLKFLEAEDDRRAIFALRQFLSRKVYEENILNRLKTYAMDASVQWQRLFIQYLESAPKEIYYFNIERLLSDADTEAGIRYLSSLKRNRINAPQGYFAELSAYLNKFSSYQEVDLFLSIVEESKTHHKNIIENCMHLLEEEIFIARRAYWFLAAQELNKDQKKQLTKFQKQNRDFL